jgi:hypothetical protein
MSDGRRQRSEEVVVTCAQYVSVAYLFKPQELTLGELDGKGRTFELTHRQGLVMVQICSTCVCVFGISAGKHIWEVVSDWK